MRKRFHRWVTLLALILLGSTLLFLLLPYLFDLYISPRLIAGLPFTEKELSLSRLSPWKIRGTLALADENRPTLSVPRFELYYTPTSLLRGKIDGLLLDSASLQVDIQDGQPIINGLSSHQPSAMQEDNTSPFLLPLGVETIILRNCVITVHRNLQKPVTLLVDGHFSLGFLEQPEKMQLLSTLSGQIQLGGDLNLSGELGLTSVESGYEAHFQLQATDIGQLSDLFAELKDAQLTGGLSLNGKVSIGQLVDRITDYKATVKLPGFRFSKNEIAFENISKKSPITIQLSGNLEKTGYTLTNVLLSKPEKGALDLKGEMDIPEGTFNGIGHLLFQKTHSAVQINYNGKHQESGTSIGYQLAGDAFSLKNTLSVGPFTADGKVDFDGVTVDAILNSRFPEIAFKKSEIKLINLSLQLPFQYPPLAAVTAGKLTIKDIQYQGSSSGQLGATLIPSPEGVTFNTSFTTPFVPDLHLVCDGSAQLTTDFSAHCRFPATQIDSATFPSFVHLPEKLSLSGKLSATGEFHIADKVPGGKLTVDYHDGTLTQGGNKLSDINVGIVFPHLPLLQSDPGQLCTIGQLDFGKINLSDARINFRIENERSVFIEKILANWCSGKVEAGSFFLARDMKKVETTLYCDRLGFSKLLAQFGMNRAEGQGSLNGRIPMQISSKGVIFDDGFLFSTPGNSGIVRFTDTKQLRQGMSETNSSAYLDYSMKALENFSYNWAKLSFNSRKDDLLITMQLDGKPADPLPFGYKNGQIVPSNQGPGLQHPIRLDVNFRFPMQDLFQYGKNIQSIMENM